MNGWIVFCKILVYEKAPPAVEGGEARYLDVLIVIYLQIYELFF